MGIVKKFKEDATLIYDATVEHAAFHYRILWPHRKEEKKMKELTFSQFYDKWINGTLYEE